MVCGSASGRKGESGPAFDVVVTETEAALALSPEVVATVRQAARVVLASEPGRLREIGLDASRCSGVEVSITFTDDPGMRELNARWLGRDCPTDVLSFFMGDDEADIRADARPASEAGGDGAVGGSGPADLPFLLGDVVVSVDTARHQAEEYGRPFPEELCRLVAHGVLHLLGYLDETEEDARLMHAREDAVLGRLGFAV